MNAIILSVGDELVLGQTVDTNSAWLSNQLAAVGCGILAHKTVGDDQDLIELAIADAADLADVILISGGIGPTEDDLTRQALASVTESPLVENEQWTAELQAFFKKVGRTMPESNRIQAMIPAGAQMLWNPCGTAAGIQTVVESFDIAEDGSAAPADVTVFSMPGVPKEMKAMFKASVLPWIAQRTGGAVILSRTLHTFGAGESAVAEKLGALMTRGRNPSVGTTVSQGIVSLRVNARFDTLAEATAKLDETVSACQAALGSLIFGQDGQSLAEIVAHLLKASNRTIATAESCTGGLLAKMLTDIAGSSAYFKQGVVTYSNVAKTNMLGVPESLFASDGAVSEPVVAAMAAGALNAFGQQADYALAISGIAGPDGGTPTKPVGTVCIALADKNGSTVARTFVFPGDREMIRDRSAKMALALLRFHLQGERPPF